MGRGGVGRPRSVRRGVQGRVRGRAQWHPAERGSGRPGRESPRRLRPHILDAEVSFDHGLCRRRQARARGQYGRRQADHGLGREEPRRGAARHRRPQGAGPDRQSRLRAVPTRYQPRARSSGAYPRSHRQSHAHARRQMAGAPCRQALEPQQHHRLDLPCLPARRARADRLSGGTQGQAWHVRDFRRPQGCDRRVQSAPRRDPRSRDAAGHQVARGPARNHQALARSQARCRGSRGAQAGLDRPGCDPWLLRQGPAGGRRGARRAGGSGKRPGARLPRHRRCRGWRPPDAGCAASSPRPSGGQCARPVGQVAGGSAGAARGRVRRAHALRTRSRLARQPAQQDRARSRAQGRHRRHDREADRPAGAEPSAHTGRRDCRRPDRPHGHHAGGSAHRGKDPRLSRGRQGDSRADRGGGRGAAASAGGIGSSSEPGPACSGDNDPLLRRPHGVRSGRRRRRQVDHAPGGRPGRRSRRPIRSPRSRRTCTRARRRSAPAAPSGRSSPR